MALSAGTRLGPHEILEPLGAGGMGEVYRARDTRLDRTVALKVLPAELAADPQLKARFEREARAISALAHPNICTLHDVGEQDGRTFLVMEHLVGETLAERLKKGPLPLDKALEVATQIADALAAAHKQGIVHRDLKPANVMLTKTGARLLDFGLALLTAHGEQPAVEVLTSAPTEPEPLTARGTIMGTLPYMAPEQVEGKPADARTDLWALGTVLYEMLTGERPFQASNPTSLVGAILEREPAPLKERQPLTPPSLERLVRRCLAKDPDDRWDTAHDVAEELRWVAETADAPGPEARGRPARLWLLALALAAVAVVASLGGWALRRPASAPVVRSLLDVQPAESLALPWGRSPCPLPPGGSRTALAWTPDGKALVFVGSRGGRSQLFARSLDQDQARPLPGTEGARVPAVSPDGEWIVFWSRTGRSVKKVRVSGGPVSVLPTPPPTFPGAPTGMAWGLGNRLFLGPAEPGPIIRLLPDGQADEVTTPLEGERAHILPSLLPGRDVVLFTVRKRVWTWGDEDLVALDLATGERKVLVRDAADGRYLPSGHLAFLRRGVLHAVAFDPESLEILGQPVPLLEGVAQVLAHCHPSVITGSGQFAVAPNGTLAYFSSEVLAYPARQLARVDRKGRLSVLPAPPRSYYPFVRVSPEGSRLAVLIQDLRTVSPWVYGLARGTFTRLTTEGEAEETLWSPDGSLVAFPWLTDGVRHLARQKADGSAPPEKLLSDFGSLSSWSPDGRWLATRVEGDLWVADLRDSPPKLQRITETAHLEMCPEFSPDGHWLAYQASDSGRFEVYVQPWPGPGQRHQVSIDGGNAPAWNPDGKELFFIRRDSQGLFKMMVVGVNLESEIRIGSPRALFDFDNTELTFGGSPRLYDVAPDGQSFYVVKTPPATYSSPPVTHIHLVQNWLEEVKSRVPTGR